MRASKSCNERLERIVLDDVCQQLVIPQILRVHRATAQTQIPKKLSTNKSYKIKSRCINIHKTNIKVIKLQMHTYFIDI